MLETQMQHAFRKFLGIPPSNKPSNKPMWNATVSYKTYQVLKRQGVLA